MMSWGFSCDPALPLSPVLGFLSQWSAFFFFFCLCLPVNFQHLPAASVALISRSFRSRKRKNKLSTLKKKVLPSSWWVSHKSEQNLLWLRVFLSPGSLVLQPLLSPSSAWCSAAENTFNALPLVFAVWHRQHGQLYTSQVARAEKYLFKCLCVPLCLAVEWEVRIVANQTWKISSVSFPSWITTDVHWLLSSFHPVSLPSPNFTLCCLSHFIRDATGLKELCIYLIGQLGAAKATKFWFIKYKIGPSLWG